ncbi:MAG: hypothetical protein JSS62_02105 [Verrucomicrobia bacterium]|nr:hypothetical protein [Verrucomicrobiota bacterium]MBS0645609.1 hypothetical protein [Verrucomicrobiota bacterium]
MRLLTYFLPFFLTASVFGSYFDHPPVDWQCIDDPAQLPKTVHVLYVGHGTTRFAPTIHLSSEPLASSLEDYIQTAKNYHQRSPDALCQDLGRIETCSGIGRVIKIDSPSVYGEVSLLQAYILCQQRAYVVTGTSLKEDFGSFSEEFYRTVQSFHLKNCVQTKSFKERQ